MRILIDECVDESFRHHLAEYNCETCRYAGLAGVSNGKLLSEAERRGFDVLITVDRNIGHQQSFRDRSISVIVLEVRSTDIGRLLPLIPRIRTVLEHLVPGQVVRIPQRRLNCSPYHRIQ